MDGDQRDWPGFSRRHLLGGGLLAVGGMSLSKGGEARELNEKDALTRWAPYSHYPGKNRPWPQLNPVSYWNDVSLQLVALDHSIDAKDARAPGPCATARALALVHIVMADAAAAVLDVDYRPLYLDGPRFPGVEYPEAFIGGAAARMLEHIYCTPAHTQFIGTQRLQFLKQYDQGAHAAWNAGLSFARNRAFVSRWDWRAVRYAALLSTRQYQPRPGEHVVDPYNPDQKYYGVTWGEMAPLLSGLHVDALGPGDPPPQNDPEFRRDADEVKEIGIFRPAGPTLHQVKTGLFWAYDGARLIGAPIRLLNQIIRQVAESDRISMPELARLLALTNLAMADAGIVCWWAKYDYRVWRPVVAIPALYAEGRNWRPFGAPRTNPVQFALGSDTQFRLVAESMLGSGVRGSSGGPGEKYSTIRSRYVYAELPVLSIGSLNVRRRRPRRAQKSARRVHRRRLRSRPNRWRPGFCLRRVERCFDR